MIKKADSLTEIIRTDKWNGKIVKILENDELQEKCRLFSKITVDPGSEVPLHIHNDDVEVYYILSGNGLVNDNGVMEEVRTGDVVYTKKGESHSIKNISNSYLEFIALIILL